MQDNNSIAGKCLDEITNLLYKIDDPVHLSNVHDWVIKLTTGEPSSCKTDYLRLLEYTLKSGEGIREPFVRPPPDGPLPDMNGLVRRPKPSIVVNDGGHQEDGDDHKRMVSLAAGGSACGGYDDDDDDDDDCRSILIPFGGSKVAGGRKTVRTPVAACPTELVDMLCGTDCESVSLKKFVADVAPFTCDDGELLSQVANELLSDFQYTAQIAFEDRTQKLGNALAKEQVALLLRFRTTGQRMLSRAQVLQDYVRELMPKFQYDDFIARPETYVKQELARNPGKPKCGSDDDQKARGSPGPVREVMDPAVEQKTLLCTLNWLRCEVERAECENTKLSDRHDAVVAAIVVASKKKIDNECQFTADKYNAKCKLDELRKQSAKQVSLIDCYMEKMSFQNRSEKRRPC